MRAIEVDDERIDVEPTIHEMAVRFPRLTAYDDEARRIQRLERVSDAYAKSFGHAPCEVAMRLIGLHDHKGDLVVVWTHDPAPEDYTAMCKAWEAECEDPAQVFQYALFTVADAESVGIYQDVVTEIILDYANTCAFLAEYPIMVCEGEY